MIPIGPLQATSPHEAVSRHWKKFTGTPVHYPEDGVDSRPPMSNAQELYKRIVLALSSDVYRYAFYLCKNEQLAEDLVQETFMRAWRFLDSLKDERKAKSWLFTTVRRELARHHERYRPGFDDVELDTLPGSRDTDTETLVVRRAIAALPPEYREPLVLQVLGGYTGNEIADMLELPRATVNTRLFRARQKLRRIFEKGVYDLDLNDTGSE